MADKHSQIQRTKEALEHPVSLSSTYIYLLGYNIFQFCGWTIILFQTVHYIGSKGIYLEDLWNETSICLKLFQSLAVFEIIHATAGIVKSNVISTTVQVFSRVFIVWGICNAVQASQLTYGLPLILIAWSITEVTRYSFYFLNIMRLAPSLLVYLRYTLFIGLYPMGVIGEQVCILAALPHIHETKMFSISMPNALNFTFDFYNFCIILMTLYIPFFPQLYLHMFSQRKKILGKSDLHEKED